MGRAVAVLVCAVAALWTGEQFLHKAEFYPDFTVFWAASQNPARAYNFEAVRALQSWVHRPGPRPFAYPPTFLLFLPFRGVAFATSYLIWVGISTVAFVSSLWLRGWRWLAIGRLFVSYLVLVADLRGQSTMLVAAMLTAAIGWLPNRSRLAGALFGVALCIKPQATLLLPIALASGRHWASIRWTTIVATSLVALTTLIFGWQRWPEWFADIPKFSSTARSMGIVSLTPSYLIDHQLIGFPALIAKVLAGLVGAVVVALVYRLSDRREYRLCALVAGSLMCAPYSASYDMAFFAAAALEMAFPEEPGRWPLAVVAILFLLNWVPSAWIVLGIAMFVAVAAVIEARKAEVVAFAAGTIR